jgi:hypothetical protein
MFNLAKKRERKEMKRRNERTIKMLCSQTAEGVSMWKTRKYGKFISELIQNGYTEKEAYQKAKKVFIM